MNATTGVLLVGAVAVGAYFVINATSQPTNQTGSLCSANTGSSYPDWANPFCWVSTLFSASSNTINTTTNEANTILILLVILVLGAVALLVFGPQTGHIAKAVTPAFL